ncbi:MAG TPA: PilZ domain-containing protein [Polyangia bacterium]|nr:PilZ domain-containing protein [Polyangia bacterium]
MERRTEPRFDVFAQIRVRRGTVNYVMDVRNISRSGMFVATGSLECQPWFRVGQFVEVDLFIHEELENVRLDGEIVRLVESGTKEKQGFGVRFSELAPAVREVLDDLISRAQQKSVTPPPLPPPPHRS